jgi:Trk K+ transport system NAD-binding subunit
MSISVDMLKKAYIAVADVSIAVVGNDKKTWRCRVLVAAWK